MKSAATKFGDIRAKPRSYLKALVDALDARQQGLDVTSVLDNSPTDVENASAMLDDVVFAAV